MMKLIPQENPDEIRQKTARRARRFIASGPGVNPHVPGANPQKKISPKVIMKLQAEEKKERNILRTVCIKLIHFVKGRKKYTDEQMSDLIHGMQRSVLSLERVRIKMVRGRKGRRNGKR